MEPRKATVTSEAHEGFFVVSALVGDIFPVLLEEPQCVKDK